MFGWENSDHNLATSDLHFKTSESLLLPNKRQVPGWRRWWCWCCWGRWCGRRQRRWRPHRRRAAPGGTRPPTRYYCNTACSPPSGSSSTPAGEPTNRKSFLLKFWSIQVFFICWTHSHVLFWEHWYPCFGFLVTSPLGFKARTRGICLICIVGANVMYVPWDPPLVLHMQTSWQTAYRSWI